MLFNMKTLTFLFLALCSLSGYSQKYHKLLNPNSKWINSYEHSDCRGPCEYYVYSTQGDTIIDSKVYYMMQGGGFMREDTIEQRVYLGAPGNERLLYDFSVNVGDPAIPYKSQGDTVVSIDSIMIDGSFRKRINYGGGLWGPNSVIEGIGNTAGLFASNGGQRTVSYYTLECMSVDGKIMYGEGHYCNAPNINGIDEPLSQGIKFYPNPMTDKSIIEFEDPISFTFSLYNLQGQLVTQRKVANSKTMEINRGNLEPGIYLYTVVMEDGSVSQGKLVVQ